MREPRRKVHEAQGVRKDCRAGQLSWALEGAYESAGGERRFIHSSSHSPASPWALMVPGSVLERGLNLLEIEPVFQCPEDAANLFVP